MSYKLLTITIFGVVLSVAGQTQPADEALDLIQQANHSRNLGFDARAEAQYRRALAILELATGPESPHLIPALNGLAELYFSGQRYTEAESMAKRSAIVVQSTLGPRHPLLATSLNNLAAIYHAQGQYARAEPRYGTIRTPPPSADPRPVQFPQADWTSEPRLSRLHYDVGKTIPDLHQDEFRGYQRRLFLL